MLGIPGKSFRQSKTRDDARRDGAEQVKSFDNAVAALAVADARGLAAAVASMRSAPPDFFRDVPKLITEAKSTATDVQKGLKELSDFIQKLAKAAAAK